MVKRILKGLFTTILAIGIVVLVTSCKKEQKYISTVEIIVHYYDGVNSNVNIDDTHRIAETVAYHFKTDLVLEDVIETIDTSLTIDEIRKGLETVYDKKTFYVRVSFIHEDQSITKIIAQQVVESGKKLADTGRVPLLENTFTIINNAKEGVPVSSRKRKW